MTVYLVGAGPGDPGLLTRRGASLLAEADVVLYDRLVHHSLLALAPETAQLIDVGKRPDAQSGNESGQAGQSGRSRQEEVNRLLIEHGQRSRIVVRLKGGDPFVFGRGGEELEALTRAGVRWEVVPGVSSAFGVPAVVGIPVTHRGLSSSVTVVTGRVGDPAGPGGVNWEALANLDGTLVILMGMMTRAEIADALQRGGKPGSTPTAVIERGTTVGQSVVRTTLDHLAEVTLGSPSVIVVGPVAALGTGGATPAPDWPLSGRTVVVTRSGPRGYGLIEALHRLGATTIELPLTEQTGPRDGGAALRSAAHAVRRFRWVIFTSANAVNPFMDVLRDARDLGGTLVAAVGPATADALRKRGVEPDLVPVQHRAEGLLVEFPEAETRATKTPGSARVAEGNTVLFPCADLAPSTVPDALGRKGWDVERVEAYQTVALPPPDDTLLAASALADAVVFAAGSAAKAYADLRGPDSVPLRVPPLVVCVGPSTAERARSLGMSGVEEAGDPSTEGVIAALVGSLTDPSDS